MIEWISKLLTAWIYKYAEADAVQYESIIKKISLIQIHIYIMFSLFIISLISGETLNLLLSTLLVIIIRVVSGGNHFKSADHCFVVTMAAIITPLVLSDIVQKYELIIGLVTAVAYLFLTPFVSTVEKNTIKKLILVGSLMFFILIKNEVAIFVFSTLLLDQAINNPRFRRSKDAHA